MCICQKKAVILHRKIVYYEKNIHNITRNPMLHDHADGQSANQYNNPIISKI